MYDDERLDCVYGFCVKNEKNPKNPSVKVGGQVIPTNCVDRDGEVWYMFDIPLIPPLLTFIDVVIHSDNVEKGTTILFDCFNLHSSEKIPVDKTYIFKDYLYQCGWMGKKRC